MVSVSGTLVQEGKISHIEDKSTRGAIVGWILSVLRRALGKLLALRLMLGCLLLRNLRRVLDVAVHAARLLRVLLLLLLLLRLMGMLLL